MPRYGSIHTINSVSPVTDAELRFGCETIWYGNFEDEGSTLWDVPNFDTMDALDGARSAMLTPAPGQSSTATIQKRCKWYDNTKSYTLHGWIKTRNAQDANILIRYYSSRTGMQIGSESITADINGSSDWTWYFKELSIPANAWYYDIRLTCSSGGGTAQAMFDNVGLIEWTGWQEADTILSIPNPNNYLWAQIRTQEGAKSLSFAFSERRYSHTSYSPSRLQLSSGEVLVYPNPCRELAHIKMDVSGKGIVEAAIYNIRGQKVRSLMHRALPQGKHTIQWDGRNDQGRSVANGIDFIRVKDAGKAQSRRFILLRE